MRPQEILQFKQIFFRYMFRFKQLLLQMHAVSTYDLAILLSVFKLID